MSVTYTDGKDKPSKHRPWVVEIWLKAHGTSWQTVDAYRDQAVAEANASLMRERVPFADFRVRDTRESLTTMGTMPTVTKRIIDRQRVLYSGSAYSKLLEQGYRQLGNPKKRHGHLWVDMVKEIGCTELIGAIVS